MTEAANTPRQARRRAARTVAKRILKRERRQAAEQELLAFRAARDPDSLPKQGPGLKVPLGRPYAKAHGQANRSTVALTQLPNGDDIPAGCEAHFHATKGLRVIRNKAA